MTLTAPAHTSALTRFPGIRALTEQLTAPLSPKAQTAQ